MISLTLIENFPCSGSLEYKWRLVNEWFPTYQRTGVIGDHAGLSFEEQFQTETAVEMEYMRLRNEGKFRFLEGQSFQLMNFIPKVGFPRYTDLIEYFSNRLPCEFDRDIYVLEVSD